MAEIQLPLDKPTGPVEAYKLPHGEDAINAILERLDGGDEDEGGEPYSPAPDPEPQTETPSPAPDPDKPDGSQPAPGFIDPVKLASASTLLAKMQIPPAVLVGLSDEQKIAWAAQLEPVQAGTANAHRELGELRKQLADQNGNSQPGQRQEASAAPSEPVVNPLVNLTAEAASFGEQFGEDSVPSLIKPIEAAHKWAVQANQAMAAELAEVREGFTALLRRGVQRELSGEYPQLKDAGEFDKVCSLASALAETGEYSDPFEVMRKAASVTFAAQTAQQVARQQIQTSNQRALGQPEVPQPSDRPDPAKPMSAEDRDAYALELIDSGLTQADVRAKLAQLR